MLKWLSEDCVTRGDIRGVAPLDNVLLNSRLSYYDPPVYWIEFEKKSGEVGRWDYGGDSKRVIAHWAIAHYLELRDKWGDGMIENTVKSRGFACAA
jgi:hypothetical protein